MSELFRLRCQDFQKRRNNDSCSLHRLAIGEKKFKFFVPDYTDYLILKIISARPSDIRDIAILLLKNKIPRNLKEEGF